MSGPNDKYGPLARGISRDMSEKGWVPIRYWVIWWWALGVAMVVFYVVLTPLWLGLRAAAWVAELRSRLRPRPVSDVSPTAAAPSAQAEELVSD